MDITSILEKVDSEVFGIWFLIGVLLWWKQVLPGLKMPAILL